MVARKSVGYNLFRTAVPFWRRTTCNLRGLPPKRDCISKREVGQESRAIRYIPMKQKEAVVLDTVSIFKYRGTSKLFFRSVSAQTTRGGGCRTGWRAKNVRRDASKLATRYSAQRSLHGSRSDQGLRSNVTTCREVLHHQCKLPSIRSGQFLVQAYSSSSSSSSLDSSGAVGTRYFSAFGRSCGSGSKRERSYSARA